MWRRPWGFREGFIVGAGLVLTGVLLQLAVGRIHWEFMAFPVNAAVGLLYLGAIVAAHLAAGRIYLFRWLGGGVSATVSLSCTAAATVVMGLIPQVASHAPAADRLGLHQMISAWPFFLLYAWLATSLGLALLRGIRPFGWARIPFLLNHLGLFIALLSATLGSADMQRLKMTTRIGQPEWRATNEETGSLEELPVAIELKEFSIEEYPPKLMVIDNATGHTLPVNHPQHLLLEDSLAHGQLLDWDIEVTQSIPMAAPVFTETEVRYARFPSMGGAYAVCVRAVDRQTRQVVEGWVSCGSFAFPYNALKMDSTVSLVMPEREPKRFASEVVVYTQGGTIKRGIIEVNRPLKVDGWKIYQVSYDEEKGRWSDVSIFELVRDPWLPVVYVGIVMMMLGAIGLFVNAQRKRAGNGNVE